jgi:negative regulator of replication initiation
MAMHSIEIDDTIWKYLKKFAEPFEDTPNSVLHRLLFGDKKEKNRDTSPSISIQGVPKGLSQILEVLYEMEINGYSRSEATNRVAENRGTAPQTIIDKYCRQLNKRAHEIDQLLSESDYAEFKRLLINKFVHHKDVIDVYFDTITADIDVETGAPNLGPDTLVKPLPN